MYDGEKYKPGDPEYRSEIGSSYTRSYAYIDKMFGFDVSGRFVKTTIDDGEIRRIAKKALAEESFRDALESKIETFVRENEGLREFEDGFNELINDFYKRCQRIVKILEELSGDSSFGWVTSKIYFKFIK